MIRTTITDEKRARRIVATVTVDGREYARLAAIAEKFNEWTRRGLFGWTDSDNTPASVLQGFFLTTLELDDEESCHVAQVAMDGLDMGEELPFAEEVKRRKTYSDEMHEAVAEADRSFSALPKGAQA